jgi:lactoylglutathione lyase
LIIKSVSGDGAEALNGLVVAEFDQFAFVRIDLRQGRLHAGEGQEGAAKKMARARAKTAHLVMTGSLIWHECVVLANAGIILGAMSAVKKLLHTRYRVNDLEKTVHFYTKVLGLQEVRRHKSPRGSELVFLKAPGSEELIEICSFPSSGPVQVQADLTHLAFEVDSLEEFRKRLVEHGLQYSDGPHMKDNGSGFAFVDAPEGYEIEIMQLAKTSGSGY